VLRLDGVDAPAGVDAPVAYGNLILKEGRCAPT